MPIMTFSPVANLMHHPICENSVVWHWGLLKGLSMNYVYLKARRIPSRCYGVSIGCGSKDCFL